MQIILMEKVINLGTLGDVVKVKDGYARNFLIPQGKAKRATSANLKHFEEKRAELEKVQAAALAAAQTRAAQLAEFNLVVSQKAGMDGRLFGSVTNGDIADALNAKGIAVAKAEVRMPNGPLKAIGEFPVTIALHTDVIAEITVTVQADASK
ncbi:MAG: 50S ribosomal protein L9 [Burkholderiales bacterium]